MKKIICLLSIIILSTIVGCKEKQPTYKVVFEKQDGYKESIDNSVEPEEKKHVKLENQSAQNSVKTDLMTLVENFNADGSPILVFKNSKGEIIQVGSFEMESINKYMLEDEYGTLTIDEKYINKIFKVTYVEKQIVSAESTENGSDGYMGYHILKMDL